MVAFENARKIWIDTPEELNVYADFISRFSVSDTQTPLMLFITADSNYAVSVNGKAVGSLQYADFPEYKVYDTYDITPYVHSGENELLVTGYCQGESSLVYRKGEAGVMFEVCQGETVLCQSDSETLCRLNAGYQSGEIERITMQLSFSFRYDAVAAEAVAPWQPCVVRKGYEKLYPRPIEKLMVCDRIPTTIVAQGVYFGPQESGLPAGEHMKQSALVSQTEKEMGFDLAHREMPADKGVTLTAEKGDGMYLIVDLGREEAGLMELEFEMPCEADVYIGFGEHLENQRVMTSIDGRQFAAVYHAKQGANTFIHRFKRIAGRYLQVHFPTHTVAVQYIGLRPTRYPLTDRGGLVCDDKLHSRIYEVAKHTLQLCMHEHYEDCPWREQALYAMDSRVEMLCAYRAFEAYDFTKASLRLFAHSQRENGQLELCAPAWAPIYIPSFTLCYVISSAEYLAYSGDKAFLKEIYPVIRRILETFSAKMTEKGLIDGFTEPEAWVFYEWAPGLDGRNADLWPPETSVEFVDESAGGVIPAPLNAYFSMALKAGAAIATALGEEQDAVDYTAMRATINQAMDTVFWDEELGLYHSYLDNGELKHRGELTQALMLRAGAVPPEKCSALRRKLYEGADWVPITMGSMIHKYEALLEEPETYRQAVFDDIAKQWGGMLQKGATSFWETFNGYAEYTFGGAGSLCHGWAALPIYIYYTYGADAGLSGFTVKSANREENATC